MLERAQVQSLTNKDAVVAFFGASGYNVNARLEQTAANLGISPEATVRRIRHIERIANQEDFFQVYLFEVDSVTVDLTRALARTFRDFHGHYLLVLTSDYEQIDFVLVETLLATGAESGGPMQAQRKRGFRPLVLSVKRLAPGRIDRRVLARFAYTEADPLAQYEKLLSAYSVAFWSEEHFNNRALFSDYFLLERLRDRPEWQEDIAPQYKVFQGLLPNESVPFAGHTEAVVRASLLVPAFEALGFVATEQKKATDNVERPDYALHAGDNTTPVTFALTYCWNRNLDGPDDTRDPDTPQENPSQTVISVLENSPCDWAIVTNGKTWRLYSKKAHSRATNYYEVDLPEIMALPDPSEALRYFWLFFRAAAFAPRGEAEDRKCFLDELLDGSQTYAKKLGEQLKDRVFREIFPHFAAGFAAGMGGTEKLLALPDEERALSLGEFYQGTLTFLYRLLFLSYAEARDLLPVKEHRGYYQKSLLRLKEEIRDKGGQSESTRAGKLVKSYTLSGREIYDRLTELFALIDKGDPSINLPTYNGGLFMTDPSDDDDTEEAAHARFLRDHFIPDRHLAMGLDLMARVEDEKKLELVFIDYKSLGVRQLGSIYEGLLEFKVEIATEKLGVTKMKGKDVYRLWKDLSDREHKAAERREDIVLKGDVYLSNDKSERKATGSYYTPDYIVEYIVEHAVAPVLQEKFDAMRPKLREAQKRYKESVELNRQRVKAGSKAQDPDVVVGNAYADLAEELFDLKVLDPAMGSGHFLVEVVDYVTDRMIDFLNGFPWNPVAAGLRRMRESILEHMDESGISIDHARLTDTNLLKRHVLKRCIYGVDINPMAVELAKVSLWLDCFTLGAPLSFLDHHLKCGNSLIGIDIETVKKAVETDQLLLFSRSKFAGVMMGADLMRKVGRLSDVTVEQMHQSQREYKRARDELAPYKRLLDVYVSRWFGNEPVKEKATIRDSESGQGRKGKKDRDFAVEFLQSADAEQWAQHPEQLEGMDARHRGIAERTVMASKDQRFFHWELEFPEVYYGPRPGTTQVIERLESAGFDAVVGNPPFGASMDEHAEKYLEWSSGLSTGKVESYVYFLLSGVERARLNGVLALLTPNGWLTLKSLSRVRQKLLGKLRLQSIADSVLAFDAWVNTLVVVARKTTAPSGKYDVVVWRQEISESGRVLATEQNPWPLRYKLSSDTWSDSLAQIRYLFRSEHLAVIDAIEKQKFGVDLLVEGTTGFQVYHNTRHSRQQIQTRYLHTSKQTSPHSVRYISGTDISRYVWEYGREEYVKYGSELYRAPEARFFELPHVVIQEIASRGWRKVNAAFANCTLYSDNTTLILIGRDTVSPATLNALVSIYNSRLFTWFLLNASDKAYTSGDFSRLSVHDFLKLRIPWDLHSLVGSVSERKSTGLAGKIRKILNDLPAVENLNQAYVQHTVLAGVSHNDDAWQASLLIHDMLGVLATSMSEMKSDLRDGQQKLLDHLDGALDIHPDKDGHKGYKNLLGKSSIENYLGDYQSDEPELPFAELEQVLFKNRSRLGVSLSDAGLMHRLREEYEKSLATLLPLKWRLAATDALIDQIVYRLYGLTVEEIAIVEGKSETSIIEVKSHATQKMDQYTPAAREGDPWVLREVITASALLGPSTVVEVAANVKDRAAIPMEYDDAESIVREFTRLGWMQQEEQARVALSEAGKSLANGSASRSPYEFARALALAHDATNGRLVSRILGRLWELNPTHQGAVIIPRPQLPDSVPVEPDAVEAWIEAQSPKWLKSLEQQMPGFVPALPTARFVSMVREPVGDAWPAKKKATREKERLQKSITEQFMKMLFGNLRIPMRDLDIWQTRLDWAGLTMTARNLPGIAGWVWFPVGAFRENKGEGFRLVEGLVWQKLAFYVHEPEGAAFETQFVSTLYGEYHARQQEEGVEYVSLPAVRDRVCYKLRIGAGSFEQTLTAVFPKAIRGDLPYGMALEVDITPAERNRLGTTIPIVIDGTPRHIIAMSKKKSEGSK